MRNRIVIACCCLLATSPLYGQTALRWKLQAGDHLDLAISQKTQSEVTYSGKKTVTTIDLAMQLTWRVLAVESGKFRLQQSLDRVTVSLVAPPAGEVKY